MEVEAILEVVILLGNIVHLLKGIVMAPYAIFMVLSLKVAELLCSNFTYHLQIPTQIARSVLMCLPKLKKEMRQLLVERNKAKAKKAANIEEIQSKLRGTTGGSHKHLFDDGDDDDEENEVEDDDVYMYSPNMNPNERPDERTDYWAACRASKSSEWNHQQEEGFMRGK